MKKRNEVLFKEVEGLSESLSKDQVKIDQGFKNNIIWGVIGVSLGVLATSYVKR